MGDDIGKAWRNYVNNPHGPVSGKATDDIADMLHIYDLTSDQKSVVTHAATSIDKYLASTKGITPDGDLHLKDAAFKAIEAMEIALADVVSRYD